jgi:timeless
MSVQNKNFQHIIWVLKRDQNEHEFRRYIGHKKVLKTDLLPMLIDYCDDEELTDVLLRLLVNLTNPALLLYKEKLPKDGPGRRNYLDLVEILQDYKEAFVSTKAWAVLGQRLQKSLEIVSVFVINKEFL